MVADSAGHAKTTLQVVVVSKDKQFAIKRQSC